MKITSQELKFSEYNDALYLNNKNIVFDESNIVCVMITKKDNVTKNDINFTNVEGKQLSADKTKKVISYKDFKIFFNDGSYTNFTVYDNNELENTLKKMRKLTNSIKPILFDNFLEQSPLVFNNDNYCYVKKEFVEKTTIRQGHINLGDEFFVENNNQPLILKQLTPGQFNFNILELDIGIRKIKLNMYTQNTLEHNQLYAPGLISIKQKIKKML